MKHIKTYKQLIETINNKDGKQLCVHKTESENLLNPIKISLHSVSNALTGSDINEALEKLEKINYNLRDELDKSVIDYMNKNKQAFALKYTSQLEDKFPDFFFIKENNEWKKYSYEEAKQLVK